MCNLSLTLSEEHQLRVFQNRMLKKRSGPKNEELRERLEKVTK